MFNAGDRVEMINPGWSGLAEQPTSVIGTVVRYVEGNQFIFHPDNPDMADNQFGDEAFKLVT